MKNDGGAAFPIPNSDLSGSYDPQPGMTLRDYFAAKAMASMLTGVVGHIGAAKDVFAYADGPCNAVIVERAYVLADAMIAEREK